MLRSGCLSPAWLCLFSQANEQGIPGCCGVRMLSRLEWILDRAWYPSTQSPRTVPAAGFTSESIAVSLRSEVFSGRADLRLFVSGPGTDFGSHTFGGCLRAIVIGPEPLIPGRFGSAVIAFEISVVQLVMEVGGVEDGAVTDDQLFKTRVRKGWSKTAAVKVHQQNHGMGRDDKMDQDRGNVKDMFHRVHGHSGPWSDMDIAMMQSMYRAIEGWPVQQPMNGVEV